MRVCHLNTVSVFATSMLACRTLVGLLLVRGADEFKRAVPLAELKCFDRQHADFGDRPWEGDLPKAVLAEIEQAKGKVFEMADEPWWCVVPLCTRARVLEKSYG